MSTSKALWEELGISVDDIVAKQSELGDRIFQHLANKLESLSSNFCESIKGIFEVGGDSLAEALKSLYVRSKADFIDVYALSVFAANVNPEIIYDIAITSLHGDITNQITERTIDPAVVLIPLLRADQESIRKIFYLNLLQRSTLKKYVCESPLAVVASLETVTFQRIKKLLKEYEDKKPPKRRRPVKLWWFDFNGGRATIVFRREKAASTEIKLVKRNIFQRTGDEKIFILSDGGNVLELFSRREPKRTVKVAEFILGKLTGQTIKYSEFISSFDSLKVGGFISRLSCNEVPNTELLSIRVRNVPLANSPTLEMECSECLVPAIKDLEETHNLPILGMPQDILSLRMKLDGRSYNLKTRADGNKVEFISDNKNLRDKDKQKLTQFLNEQLNQ